MNRCVVAICFAFLTGAGVTTQAFAQIVRPVAQLEGVGVVEHLDQKLPLDLKFVDERGKPLQLQSLFDGTRPVVLTLNYTNCPMLCGLKLRGMIEALAEMSLEPGRDYRVVSVSIDPLESPMQARMAKQGYLREFGRGDGQGWTFLTGREPQIRALADAIGFQYQYVPERKEYAHAAVFMICTPDGRVSRYLYGIRFEPKTVQLSLVEAAQGRIGTTFDQVLLFCFHYDATSGNYAPAAVSLMKTGAAATVIVLALFFLPWKRAIARFTNPASAAAAPIVSENLT